MKTSTVVKVSILVICLCSLLFIPSEAFSDNTSFFQQDNAWQAFVGENNKGKYVAVQTVNQRKMIFSFFLFKDRPQIEIIGTVSSNVNIYEISLNCDISVDKNNKYYTKAVGYMENSRVSFIIYGFNWEQLLPEMSRGRSINFRIYGEGFSPYNASFSLYGFTSMYNYGIALFNQTFR